MKFRTSFCNGPVLRKDLTRFAPLWGCYTIVLLLMLTVLIGLRTEYIRCLNAADYVISMSVVNLIYAFLAAQMLFGDLFNNRMCNALHALPLKRECWFGTHVTAALLFSLVPNVALALIAMPFLGQGWMIAVYWLAAGTMQYIFFLGTALVSVMLVGNRFAMAAVYVLINFLSILFYWFAATIYEPLLYGVRFTNDIFVRLSPAVQMIRFHLLVDVELLHNTVVPDKDSVAYVVYATNDGPFTIGPGPGWGYLAICAGIGIALAFLALHLYRRRRLETAGDFIAIRGLEPIFLVLFTLAVGAFFQLFTELFGLGTQMLFLAAGMVVGYFGGLMLLKRTTRVFRLKTLAGIAAIGILMAGSIGLMKLDAFGIVRKIPEVAKVDSVVLSDSYYIAFNSPGYTLTEPDEIEAIRELHQQVLDGRHASEGEHDTALHLVYTLTDGTTIERYYSDIPVDSAAGRKLKELYSAPEFVLGLTEDRFAAVAKNITYCWIGETALDIQEQTGYDWEGLLHAIAADCATGNMVQDTSYHAGEYHLAWLELSYELPNREADYLSVSVYECCENTIRWLEENGFHLSYNSVLG